MSVTSKIRTLVASTDRLALLQSELHRQYARLLRPLRLGSKPFISGDTFRAIADFRLDKITPRSMRSMRRYFDLIDAAPSRTTVLFIDLKTVLEAQPQDHLLDFFSSIPSLKMRKLAVVLHNHDKTPGPEFFLRLHSMGAKVFSPNVLACDDTVCAIPLGIENRNLRKNGVLRHFSTSSVDRARGVNGRHISVFGAFNIGTNPSERKRAAQAIQANSYEFVDSRISPRDFQESLKRSLFVISPPGNGIDCHRTWEAIYFGAVPVVLKKCLAQSLWETLPILAVDEWNDVCSLGRKELEVLFNDVRSKPLNLAFFEYWENLLRL